MRTVSKTSNAGSGKRSRAKRLANRSPGSRQTPLSRAYSRRWWNLGIACRSRGGSSPITRIGTSVIRRVVFEGSTDFPEEIIFNPNLNAIIGSRSSGKSALLAHIAYAVDPEHTIAQQVLATGSDFSDVGPAAGLSWKAVESTTCKVEWADGSTSGGQVIYIPQNWLYQISDNPKEVTDKIRPVLESHYASYFREHGRLLDSAKVANEAIGKEVGRWFDHAEELARLNSEIKRVGDKDSIKKARDEIKSQIELLRAANSLSAEDLERYQSIVSDIDGKHAHELMKSISRSSS